MEIITEQDVIDVFKIQCENNDIDVSRKFGRIFVFIGSMGINFIDKKENSPITIDNIVNSEYTVSALGNEFIKIRFKPSSALSKLIFNKIELQSKLENKKAIDDFIKLKEINNDDVQIKTTTSITERIKHALGYK